MAEITQEMQARITSLEKALWGALIEAAEKNGGDVDGWEAATALSRVLTHALELAQQQEEEAGNV